MSFTRYFDPKSWEGWSCLGIEFIRDPEEKERHGESAVKAVVRLPPHRVGSLGEIVAMIDAAPRMLEVIHAARKTIRALLAREAGPPEESPERAVAMYTLGMLDAIAVAASGRPIESIAEDKK